jgi:hypothetical protein
MDKTEFNQWLQYHQKAYPALADWFANLPDTKGTLAIWFDAIRWITKEDAAESTMRMIRGAEPLVKFNNWHDTPRFLTEHAETIKRERRPKREFTLPDPTKEVRYRCLECFDTGVILVFHGREVRAVRDGSFHGPCVHRAARACGCKASEEKYAGMIESGLLTKHSPSLDVPFPTTRRTGTVETVEEDIAAILQALPVGPVSLDDWANRT